MSGEFLITSDSDGPKKQPTQEKIIMTQSAWSVFRNCRKKYKLRYLDGLVPIQKSDALTLGSLVHECLEYLFEPGQEDRSLNDIEEGIGYKCMGAMTSGRASEKIATFSFAMMREYIREHGETDKKMKTIANEMVFHSAIVNPETGRPSKIFEAAGVFDKIVEYDGKLWLMEHKTTSKLDQGYLDKIWMDFQIHYYCNEARKAGYEVEGAIYDILLKPASRLDRKIGETDQEFEARKAGMKCPDRAKQQTGETIEEYLQRLADWYKERRERKELTFYRHVQYMDKYKVRDIELLVWEMCQTYLDCRKRDNWFPNTSQCFFYNMPCPYWPICSSNDNTAIIEELYERAPAHSELELHENKNKNQESDLLDF